MSHPRRHRTEKPETVLARDLIGARAALAVGAFATALTMLAGCTSPLPASATGAAQAPSRSESVAVSDVPSAPTAGPQITAAATSSPLVGAGLGPDTLGLVVATDGLRVRSLPAVGDESQRLEPTLPAGVRFYVVDGPATSDGYAWYQVQPYGRDERLPFGWIAAGSRDGEPWVDQFPLGCDTSAPSAESLVIGEPLEHLFCSLGGDSPRTSPPGPEIAFEGNVYCTLADDHWGPLSGPDWIDQLGYCELRTDLGSIRLQGTPITGLLDGDTNPVEGRYALVGHFDDPGARQCREGPFGDVDPPDPAQVVLRCRTYFVVTEVTPLS
jgi:hypothetical protein